MSYINIYTIGVTFLVQFQYTSAQSLPPGYNGGHSEVQGQAKASAAAQQHRFTIPTTTEKKREYVTVKRISFAEHCDYLAHFCLKAYDTGMACGRTMYFTYYTFKNYCLLDYTNCMERYEVWQVAYMGNCSTIKPLTDYLLYPYDNDKFLDEYILEEQK